MAWDHGLSRAVLGVRINIEASAALAAWIDIYREDPGGRLYEQLVNRAVAYLPMPNKTSKMKVAEFGALAQPEMAARVVEVADAARRERVRADVMRYPSRVLANALLNTAWRNGPVENIHATEGTRSTSGGRRPRRSES
jgi:hypothetical protein